MTYDVINHRYGSRSNYGISELQFRGIESPVLGDIWLRCINVTANFEDIIYGNLFDLSLHTVDET